jgi:hypothetical protein
MVKVSITLPNNAQITFESEEPEVIHQIVDMVLRDLPRDLMQVSHPTPGNGYGPAPTEKGSSVDTPQKVEDTSPPPPDILQDLSPEDTGSPEEPDPVIQPEIESSAPPVPALPSTDLFPESAPPDRRKAEQAARSAAAGLAFIHFCQSSNPLGDMRKVVVAAEGAAQFLEMDSVSAEDLEELFDRVGWLQPHNFTQTLRNAARTKFRWLERVPGRSGHYSVTGLGRSKILTN